jgi:hypothetical protein
LKGRLLGNVAGSLAVIAFVELIVLGITYGYWPSTALGWVLLLLLGPVVWVVWDALDDLVLSYGSRLSRRRFSLKRVLFLLLYLLTIAGVTVGVWLLL